MTRSLKPLTTTLIGGVVFLLPLLVVIYVLGHGLALAARAAAPLVALLPQKDIGGITLASVVALALLLLLCFGAGLLARAAVGPGLRRPLRGAVADAVPALFGHQGHVAGPARRRLGSVCSSR